ncbi:MAG: hypothetical protein NW224_23595 [Leptolyngbyaceae cyanobacterium bins.302]|nr:hypothetical protein [Leptolyngbyaceae cyanobacterium bins.302]
MYQLRYSFSFGSGVCLWSANQAAQELFQDLPVIGEILPISKTLQKRMEFVLSWYDTFLDWDNAPDLTHWSEQEAEQFCVAAQEVLHLLRQELGEEFEIVDESKTTS